LAGVAAAKDRCTHSRRLRDSGYDMSAKKVEVHLPDSATAVEIKKRRDALHQQLMAWLIYDGFA
jgi:hypothetical protein